MKFIKFFGCQSGVELYIDPDQVVAVQPNVELFDNTGDKRVELTVITTLDGKEHRVQGKVAEIIALFAVN